MFNGCYPHVKGDMSPSDRLYWQGKKLYFRNDMPYIDNHGTYVSWRGVPRWITLTRKRRHGFVLNGPGMPRLSGYRMLKMDLQYNTWSMARVDMARRPGWATNSFVDVDGYVVTLT